MNSEIIGFHVLAKGNLKEAKKIAKDIFKNQRLLVGTGTFYGSGVYAYYKNEVPEKVKHLPGVVFKVSEDLVKKIEVPIPNNPNFKFFMIPGKIGKYITIEVLGFKNLQTKYFPEFTGITS